MIIQSPTPAMAVRGSYGAARNVNHVQTGSSGGKPTDSVQISQDAQKVRASHMAVLSPALLISEEQVQIKMSLLGTLMEALFGQQESNETTPEEEMVQAVFEKPMAQKTFQEVMQEVIKNAT